MGKILYYKCYTVVHLLTTNLLEKMIKRFSPQSLRSGYIYLLLILNLSPV